MSRRGISHREAEYLASIGGWIKMHNDATRARHPMRAKVVGYDGRRLTIQLPNHKHPETVGLDQVTVWRSRTAESEARHAGA